MAGKPSIPKPVEVKLTSKEAWDIRGLLARADHHQTLAQNYRADASEISAKAWGRSSADGAPFDQNVTLDVRDDGVYLVRGADGGEAD